MDILSSYQGNCILNAGTDILVRKFWIIIFATSQAQKDLTTEYAKDVDGVKDVKNEMVVSKPTKKTQTTGGKVDDASITGLSKMTLLYHRSTSGLNTSVTTRNGVVTLSGKAKNAAEKDLATRYVNDVNGVKSVKNKMTIE